MCSTDGSQATTATGPQRPRRGVTSVALARENFAALNAHDLDRFDGQLAADFSGEAPGASGPLKNWCPEPRLHPDVSHGLP